MDLCRKVNQKIHALARLSNYIDHVKLEILMNSFISSQFNYFPLVWMFSDRATNAKLNCSFEKVQRLVCKGSELKLKQIKEKYVTIHQHNLQLLMVEIFKTKNNLNPTFMKNIFTERDVEYNLRTRIICNCRISGQQNMELKIFSTQVTIYGPHYRMRLRTRAH